MVECVEAANTFVSMGIATMLHIASHRQYLAYYLSAFCADVDIFAGGHSFAIVVQKFGEGSGDEL
jgi:hypothetical protein